MSDVGGREVAPWRSFGRGETMRMGFRPKMRIRRSEEFERVLKQGIRWRDRFFSLHLLPGEGKCARLGIVASRHTGNAVERNRAKRVLREAFRRLSPSLPPGLDLVAVAKRSIVGAKPKDVERALRVAVERRAG